MRFHKHNKFLIRTSIYALKLNKDKQESVSIWIFVRPRQSQIYTTYTSIKEIT